MEMNQKQVLTNGKLFQSNKINFPLNLLLDGFDVFMTSIADDPVPTGGPSPSDFGFSLDDLLPPLQPQLDDFEEFMRNIGDDKPVPGGTYPADLWISLDDLMPEGVPSVNNRVNCSIQSQLEEFMMNMSDEPDPDDPSLNDFVFSLDDLLPEESRCNLAGGNEDPQATSSVKPDFPEPNLIDKEDFLEMDDLIGSEHTSEFFANPKQALENHLDGLLESDLFEDADMFFCDEDSSDQGLVSKNDVVVKTNNANLQNGNYSSFRHWSHDQQCTVNGLAQRRTTIAPTVPRLSCDGNSSNHHNVDDHMGEKHDDGTIDSWISSALWSFVESIPAPPASAAETALVNHSFDRISSFSRVVRRNPRSSGKCTSRFFSFSVLGFMMVVMWMLAGISTMQIL